MLRTANTSIHRKIDPGRVCLPSRNEVRHFVAGGYNKHYEELGRVSWRDVEATLIYETEALKEHALTEAIFDPSENDPDWGVYEMEYLGCLDLGVATCALSLRAVGCLTFSSCNGGLLGDFHHESYPLVMFFAKPSAIRPLLECAEAAGVGLENADGAALMVYASDLRHMLRFAQEIMARKRLFRQKTQTQNREEC